MNSSLLICAIIYFHYFAIVGSNQLAFPGRDKTKLRDIARVWESYYECLKSDFEHLDHNKQRKIQYRFVLPGQWVELSCAHCQRPFENPEIIWKYQGMNYEKEQPTMVDLTSTEFSLIGQDLLIKNAGPDNSGLYQCYSGSNLIAIFVVEVPLEVNFSKDAGNILLETDSSNPFYVFWNEWSECSTCDVEGKKFRYGVCMTSKSSSRGISSLFNNHFACSSKFYMLKKEGSLTTPNNLLNQIATEACKEPCPEEKHDEVIDMARNNLKIEDIRDTIEKMKNRFPETTTIILDFEIGTRHILQCPGIIHRNIPVTWKIQNVVLDDKYLANMTEVEIDKLNRIVLKAAYPEYSKIYTCWQRNTHVGSIHVYINDNTEATGTTTMVIALVVMSLLFCRLSCKALGHQRRKLH